MSKAGDFIDPVESPKGERLSVGLGSILERKGLTDRRFRFQIQGAVEKCAAEGHAWTKHGRGRVCTRCWQEEE